MPVKGAYRVQTQEEQHTVLLTSGSKKATLAGKDASFAACITGLLVFLALCLIIILITLPWRFGSPGPHHHHPDKNNGGSSSGLHGGKLTTTTTTSVLIASLTTNSPPGNEVEIPDPTEPDAEEFPVHEQSVGRVKHRPYEALQDGVSTSTTESEPTANFDVEIFSSPKPGDKLSAPIVEQQENSTSVSTLATESTTTHNIDAETFSSPQPGDQQTDALVEQQDDPWSEEQLCETGSCKTLASRMLSLMNHSVDPCTDFYEYSCGGLRTTRSLLTADPEAEVQQKITDGMGTINEDSPLHYRKFANFYKSCLTYEENFNYTERASKARQLLKEAGTFYDIVSWPGSYNLTTLIVSLLKLHSTPLFDVLLDVSSTGRGSFSLRITPPLHRSLLLDVSAEDHQPPDWKCKKEAESPQIMPGHKEDLKKSYEQYVECKRNPEEYLENVEVAMSALGVFESLHEYNRSQLMKEIRLNIETTLLDIRKYNLPNDAEFRRAVLAKEYKLMTITELQAEYTLVDWRELISSVLGERLPGNTTVQLYFSDFFDALFMELGIDLRGVNNALLGTLAHELYAGLVAPRPLCELPRMCMAAARHLMDDVASLIYLSAFPPTQIDKFKKQARELFSLSKITLEKELREAEWLQNDTATLDQLVNKLKAMTLELGVERSSLAPERSMNQVPLDGDYFDFLIALQKRYRSRMYADYASAPQSSQQLWSHFSVPYETSGTALYGLNAVLVPLGVFTSPHWFSGAPHYITTATLGTLIAHEVAHHFDTVGIKFGAKGEKDQLHLSEQAKEDYNSCKNCAELKFQFTRSHPTGNGGVAEFQVPSSLSLNERMSDESASHVAMQTYLAWLQRDQVDGIRDGHRLLPWLGMTWEQAFFVAQAQVYCTKETILDYRFSLFEEEHLPPFLRVNSLVSNSQKFAETFTCVSGLAMNPPNKCAPFPALEPFKAGPPLSDIAH